MEQFNSIRTISMLILNFKFNHLLNKHLVQVIGNLVGINTLYSCQSTTDSLRRKFHLGFTDGMQSFRWKGLRITIINVRYNCISITLYFYNLRTMPRVVLCVHPKASQSNFHMGFLQRLICHLISNLIH